MSLLSDLDAPDIEAQAEVVAAPTAPQKWTGLPHLRPVHLHAYRSR